MSSLYRIVQMVVLLTVTLVASSSCQAPDEAASAPADQNTVTTGPLEGVWRVSEFTTTGPNGTTNSSPQPGLHIYTRGHYSIVRIAGTTARPELPEDINTATASQLNAVWGPLTAQSGTYEVSGSTYTSRPIVAKNPNVMAAGVFNSVSFSVEGDTLTTTVTANQDGPVENPTTVKLTRVE